MARPFKLNPGDVVPGNRGGSWLLVEDLGSSKVKLRCLKCKTERECTRDLLDDKPRCWICNPRLEGSRWQFIGKTGNRYRLRCRVCNQDREASEPNPPRCWWCKPRYVRPPYVKKGPPPVDPKHKKRRKAIIARAAKVPQADVAREFGISRARVSQIVNESLTST